MIILWIILSTFLFSSEHYQKKCKKIQIFKTRMLQKLTFWFKSLSFSEECITNYKNHTLKWISYTKRHFVFLFPYLTTYGTKKNRKTPHVGHAPYRPRSHKRKICLQPTSNQPTKKIEYMLQINTINWRLFKEIKFLI